VSVQVKSQIKQWLCDEETSVTPSGLLPSLLSKQIGSSSDEIFVLFKANAMMELIEA